MHHGYTIKIIRDDQVECGEIDMPCRPNPPSIGQLGAAVLESIRRGEDHAKKAAPAMRDVCQTCGGWLTDGTCLADLHDAITTGDCSGTVKYDEPSVVDGPTMAALLRGQGSDPGFFRLDDTGNDTED